MRECGDFHYRKESLYLVVSHLSSPWSELGRSDAPSDHATRQETNESQYKTAVTTRLLTWGLTLDGPNNVVVREFACLAAQLAL